MLKKTALLILLLLLGAATVEYLSAPVFWQRFITSLSSGGEGAYSAVFDNTEQVAGATRESALPVAEEEDRTLEDSAVADLINYAKKFDSFALVVIHQGKVQLEWYKEGYNASSLTQSQSMHKSIQALLLGIALQDGLIASIEDPLSKYLPELQGDPKGTIRIVDLLTMTSGIKNFEAGFNPFGDAFRWLYATDTAAATYAFPVARAAGLQFDYNDLNAQLLGLIITRVSGQRYARYLSEQLWQPLGNSDALVWLDSPQGNAMHACCLLTPARNWARVGMMMKDKGRFNGRQIVPSSWIMEATQPGELTPHYGYQIWLASNTTPNPRKTGYQRSEDWLADDVSYFSGYGAQRVYVSADKDLVIVRLGPAAGYFPKIISEWDNTYLFNRSVRGIEKAQGQE